MCFELARLIVDRLGPRVRIVEEVHGFKSFAERDLLGFVDGTENPEGRDAVAAVLIGDEDPDDEDKAPDSHLTLNVIEDADGEQLQIMRFNMPFGRAGSGDSAPTMSPTRRRRR
jgi:putative iron-dependent peroxidase